MTPEEVGAQLTGLIPDFTVSTSGGQAYARATIDVPVEQWRTAVSAVRDELSCDFFDWLSAVDETGQEYSVVTHVWSTTQKFGLLVRTRVTGESPSLESIVDIYPGAAWHERETYEMFGIGFPGPLESLLLPPEFEGHPLRKSFVLASRVAKVWPGAKEPGESHDPNAPKRTTMRPPGVPAPGEWG